MQLIEQACRLLREAVGMETAEEVCLRLSTAEWWGLFRLLQRHQVAALCFDAAERQGAPRDVLLPWLAEREKTVARGRYQRAVQQELLDLLQQHGIVPTVLKGSRLAECWPCPDWRAYGDVDLYFESRHAEADQIVRDELHITIDNRSHHHTKYIYRGITIESHYEYFNHHYPRSNRAYNRMLATIAAEPTFELLYNLRHMAIHYAADGLRLKHFCDWYFLRQTYERKADMERVEREVNRFGMEAFRAALDRWDAGLLGTDEHLPYSARRAARHLAFGDSEASLWVAKAASHLSHKK